MYKCCTTISVMYSVPIRVIRGDKNFKINITKYGFK